jgi:HlyD family secretion protein
MKKKNKLLRNLGIAVVLLIVFAIIGKKAGWIGKKEKKQVTTEKAELRTIVETVSASGKVQPEVEVKISPDVSGEIVELNVREGDQVKRGQVMVKILPDIYQSNVARVEATVNATRANHENAKARLTQTQSQSQKAKLAYDRNKKLFDEKLISSSDWEIVSSTYEVAKAEEEAAQQSVSAAEYNVRSTEASLKEARDNLRKTTILAPVDGTVSKLNVEKGERVVGTSQMAGTQMMTLANLDEMEVNVDVNENDIVRVGVGDTALIEVDAYLGKKFKGVVTEVANSANVLGQSVDQVTNFKVNVRILRESYEDLLAKQKTRRGVFNPGMSATVDIMTKRADNKVSVPIQAVTTRDTTQKEKKKDGGKKSETENMDELQVKDERVKTPVKEEKKVECVFVVENDKLVLRAVKTGIQDNNHIEITEGLKVGEAVVTAPYSLISRTLKAGDEVKVVKKEDLYAKEK